LYEKSREKKDFFYEVFFSLCKFLPIFLLVPIYLLNLAVRLEAATAAEQNFPQLTCFTFSPHISPFFLFLFLPLFLFLIKRLKWVFL
jgi:hypothetical protein